MIQGWPPPIVALGRDQHERPVPVFLRRTERGYAERAGWMRMCMREQRCWVCGRPLARDCGFALSAAQLILEVSAEPPGHPECVAFPVQRIRWRRGVVALWQTHDFWNLPNAEYPDTISTLFLLGRPTSLQWSTGDESPSRVGIVLALDAAAAAFRQYAASLEPAERRDIERRIRRAYALLKHKGRGNDAADKS